MKPLRAELVCTGSELLSAKVNLYTPLFHSKLSQAGFELVREACCPDELPSIAGAIGDALRRCDLVITCGGLGPTFDDLTRQAAAQVLGSRLVHSPWCEKILRHNYGLAKLPPNFLNQCLVLEGSVPVENRNGTAFGLIAQRGRKTLVLLPGPRREWEPMFDSYILGDLKERFSGRLPAAAGERLRIAGLREMEVQELLAPVMKKFSGASFTVLAGPYTAEFHYRACAASPAAASAKARSIGLACRARLGGKLYGTGEETLESAVAAALSRRGLKLALAESCTGGLVSKLLTDIPGSSAWYLGGVNAYSNGAKERLLGVGREVLRRHGAVSREAAIGMAAGARKVFGSDHALSVTGIAGPDGGTARKPVGLVWFGLAGPKGSRAFSLRFRGGREHVRLCAANAALDALRKILK